MRNIFPDIELVKRRVMHYFRDVNYGETFTPEIREHFREAVADRLDLVQRLKTHHCEFHLNEFLKLSDHLTHDTDLEGNL